MANVVSFVPILMQGIKDWFTAHEVTATVAFGRRAWAQQDNQGPGGANRVVVFPGDESGTRAGRFLGSRQNVGQNPRPIYTWEKLFTVSVWAVDTTDPEDELLQFVAVEALLESTIQALRAYAHADMGVTDLSWRSDSPIERVYGREILFPLVLRGPLFAPQNAVAFPTPIINQDLE